MSSTDLIKYGSMIYPIMLTQQFGEISESKAAELIGITISTYREIRSKTIKAVMTFIEELPSPILILLKADKCPKCGGDGKAHGADQPFEWDDPGSYPDPCPICKGTGKHC